MSKRKKDYKSYDEFSVPGRSLRRLKSQFTKNDPRDTRPRVPVNVSIPTTAENLNTVSENLQVFSLNKKLISI